MHRGAPFGGAAPRSVLPNRSLVAVPIPQRSLRARRRAVLAVAVALLAGCVSGVPVSVENDSDKVLNNVVVAGKGFRESVGTIAAGATETVWVRPREETQITVTFVVDEQRYSGASDPIENDTINRIDVKVAPDLHVFVATNLR
jgi:PBP1b-binding outer membrane lipoprotein LpoB